MASRFSKATLAVLAALAFSGAAQSAAAQSWAVTPWVGYYLPTADIIGTDVVADEVSQQSALAFGGRVSRMFNSNWGAEFSLGYAASGIEDSDDEVDGNLMLFSLRAMYMFPTSGRMNIYGAFGLGYITRGGDAWDAGAGFDVDGKNDIAGNIALGVMFPVSEIMKLRIELEDYLYSAKFESGGIESDGQFQNDLMISAGLHIPFGGE